MRCREFFACFMVFPFLCGILVSQENKFQWAREPGRDPGHYQTMISLAGVNENGVAVGTAFDVLLGQVFYLFRDGKAIPLAEENDLYSPAGGPTLVFGINNKSALFIQTTLLRYLQYDLTDGTIRIISRHGLLNTGTGEQEVDLDYIIGMNNVGEIVASYRGQGVFGKPALGRVNSPETPKSNGVFRAITCPNSGIMEPKGMNDQGVIVGNCMYPGGTPRGGARIGFVYIDGKVTTFEDDHGFNTIPLAVSNSGVIVGGFQAGIQQPNGRWSGPAKQTGFAYDGNKFIDIGSPAPPDGGEQPTGVNSEGEVSFATGGILHIPMLKGAFRGGVTPGRADVARALAQTKLDNSNNDESWPAVASLDHTVAMIGDNVGKDAAITLQIWQRLFTARQTAIGSDTLNGNLALGLGNALAAIKQLFRSQIVIDSLKARTDHAPGALPTLQRIVGEDGKGSIAREFDLLGPYADKSGGTISDRDRFADDLDQAVSRMILATLDCRKLDANRRELIVAGISSNGTHHQSDPVDRPVKNVTEAVEVIREDLGSDVAEIYAARQMLAQERQTETGDSDLDQMMRTEQAAMAAFLNQLFLARTLTALIKEQWNDDPRAAEGLNRLLGTKAATVAIEQLNSRPAYIDDASIQTSLGRLVAIVVDIDKPFTDLINKENAPTH